VIAGDQDNCCGRFVCDPGQEGLELPDGARRWCRPVKNGACNDKGIRTVREEDLNDLADDRLMVLLKRYPVEPAPKMQVHGMEES